MPPATSEPVTIQQAFADAVKEHSTPEPATAPARTEPAAADPVPAQDTDPAAGAPPESATTETTDLISETDWSTLATLDPAKQRAELNKRWTQKTQALAAERKKLEPKVQLLEALEADPTGTVHQLAKQLGLTIAPSPQETARTETATQTAATIADQAVEAMKADLGPDLDFLAGPLAKAVHRVAETVAKAVADQAVKPVQDQTKQILDQHAAQETESVMQAFTAKRPDWKLHEPAMMTIAQTLQPGPTMTPADYLDICYRLATEEARVQAAGAKAVERLAKGAEAAETAAHPVSDSQVTITRPANATIYDAHQAAKRGIRWE